MSLGAARTSSRAQRATTQAVSANVNRNDLICPAPSADFRPASRNRAEKYGHRTFAQLIAGAAYERCCRRGTAGRRGRVPELRQLARDSAKSTCLARLRRLAGQPAGLCDNNIGNGRAPFTSPGGGTLCLAGMAQLGDEGGLFESGGAAGSGAPIGNQNARRQCSIGWLAKLTTRTPARIAPRPSQPASIARCARTVGYARPHIARR
jgi:hypothetical protein